MNCLYVEKSYIYHGTYEWYEFDVHMYKLLILLGGKISGKGNF